VDARRLQILRAMDIDVWQRRSLPSTEATALPLTQSTVEAAQTVMPAASVKPSITTPTASTVTGTASKATHNDRSVASETVADVLTEGWDALRQRVAGCTLCGLEATRTQTVFGVGNTQAEWMIIGEAPGAEEDRQGEPFVGRAGQLLNSMLKAMGFPRQQVFIANVLKCRPPGNRDPKPEEVACCLPYLLRQIELVNPRVILCVGRIAAQNLLATEVAIGKLRGTVHRLGIAQRPVVVTYHPAYLLRSPGEKRKAWEDLKLALTVYAESPRVYADSPRSVS
jgi:DNA polymerase